MQNGKKKAGEGGFGGWIPSAEEDRVTWGLKRER